jgi:hypothetical protein
MAVKYWDKYNANAANIQAKDYMANVRYNECFIDFTDTDNQTAAASDSLALWMMPKGALILSAGLEQISVSTETTNTLAARVGTVAYSGTLAGDAAVGTLPAHTDVSGGAPALLTSAVDFNLLSATAIRLTGVVRAWVAYIETRKTTGRPAVVDRDQMS